MRMTIFLTILMYLMLIDLAQNVNNDWHSVTPGDETDTPSLTPQFTGRNIPDRLDNILDVFFYDNILDSFIFLSFVHLQKSA